MRAMSLGVNAVGLTKCKACGARLNLLVAELALLYARRIKEQQREKKNAVVTVSKFRESTPISKFRESTQTPKKYYYCSSRR